MKIKEKQINERRDEKKNVFFFILFSFCLSFGQVAFAFDD